MKKEKKHARQEEKSLAAHAVILAGGRGTRFWPRSRLRTPKQLLNIVGRETMLEQTVERLLPLFPYPRLWVVTNAEQARGVCRIAPRLRPAQVLSERVGRNTAAAIGLAAIHLAHKYGDAVMAVLPADHFIADAKGYREVVQAAIDLAASGPNLVTLGIPPTRPETGYGYIERVDAPQAQGGAFLVKRFTEKPDEATAKQFLASGKFFWNAGMFFWRVSAYLDCLKKFLPATHEALDRLSREIGTRRYAAALKRIYPRLENISVDYAIMEPATRVASGASVHVLPAEVGWSDIGSWAAVYELGAQQEGANVSAGPLYTLDAAGNYVHSPDKFVAAIGLAAIHLAHKHGDAVMAVLPADHFIADAVRYREVVRAAIDLAARGPNLVTLGIPPTRAETGYGYIERMDAPEAQGGAFRVKRFTEKPDEATAKQFLASGNFFWNAGMFFWRVSTYLDCLRKFLPATHAALDRLSRDIGTRRYSGALRRIYPKLENISVDYAIMEPATRVKSGASVHVLPAEVGWSDIGSWAAVYELARSRREPTSRLDHSTRSTPPATTCTARKNSLPPSA